MNDDELVPDPQVWREFRVTPMTGWRWTHDVSLGFPPPIKIRNRNYRSRRALNAFREALVRRALVKAAACRQARRLERSAGLRCLRACLRIDQKRRGDGVRRPRRRFRAVEMLVRESAAGVDRGDLDIASWADRIQAIAVETGMIVGPDDQDRVQAMMSSAVIAPLHLRARMPARTFDDGIGDEEVPPRPTERMARASLVMQRGSDIVPEPVSWLWPLRWAIGKVTIVAGEPGLGNRNFMFRRCCRIPRWTVAGERR